MCALMMILASTIPGVMPFDVAGGPAGASAPREGTPAAGSPSETRIVLKKEGGPGAGADQPYDVRERGASDLTEFVGGRQVVFVEPFDWLGFFLLIIIVVAVVIII